MNTDFDLINHRGVEILVYRPWWDVGVMHGMTTRQLSFVGDTLVNDLNFFREAIGVSLLAGARQTHGIAVVDLRTCERHAELLKSHGDLFRREDGDAVAAPNHQILDAQVVAYGVLTADCVPIIVRGEKSWVLIHAGWRGLAQGVIGAALSYIVEPKEAVIFASAGADRYEVGQEVIQALGASAVYHPTRRPEGRYLLDTAATAEQQLRAALPGFSTHVAGVCTISDPRFNSYRRDGDSSGRCLSFVVPK